MKYLFLITILCGCSHSNFVDIKNDQDFNNVLKSDKPVIINFSKDFCPPCVVRETDLDNLYKSAGGRIVLARYEILTSYFVSKSPEISKKYNLTWFPTTSLFVNGQEVARWEATGSRDEFLAKVRTYIYR